MMEKVLEVILWGLRFATAVNNLIVSVKKSRHSGDNR